jgi:Tol biopolymer transport system component
VSAEGKDTATLTTPDRTKGELGHWWPHALPDGEHVLFTNYTTPADRSQIEVLSLKTGKRTVVQEGGYYARFVRNYIVFVRGEQLQAVPFNASTLRTSGSPVPIPLDIEVNAASGWAAFAVAPNGTLIYRTDAYRNLQLMWSDEGGNETPAIDSAARFTDAFPSPDNLKIAVVRDGDVWIYDRARKLFSRLTRTDQRETGLIWTPDSRRVIYTRDVPQYDIFMRPADGSQPEVLLVTSPNDKEVNAVSPDGRTLLFAESAGGNDIFAVPLDAPSAASRKTVVAAPRNQGAARFSPDGQWIVYASTEAGRPEVYLAPYPADRGPARQQISDEGGESPAWGPDGRTVYYSSTGRIRRVRVNPRTGEISQPESLTRIRPGIGWTMAADGRFLIGRVAEGNETRSIKVILNWASTLGKEN